MLTINQLLNLPHVKTENGTRVIDISGCKAFKLVWGYYFAPSI